MTTEPKEKIEIWDIDRLIPYGRNVKKHSEEQVERLARSIAALGVQPILVDADGEIIAGHGRRLALIRLGRTRAPVIVRADLNKDQANALRIADNKAASTEYDISMMAEEVDTLVGAGIDIEILGFSDAELSQFDGDTGDIDDSVFADDILTAVEEQKDNNTRIATEVDESAAPIADAFGFKRLTVAQSRQVRAFMTKVEAQTGLKGPDALLKFISSIGYASPEPA